MGNEGKLESTVPAKSSWRAFFWPEATSSRILLLVSTPFALFFLLMPVMGVWNNLDCAGEWNAHDLLSTTDASIPVAGARSLRWQTSDDSPDESSSHDTIELLADGRLHLRVHEGGEDWHLLELWITFQGENEPRVLGQVHYSEDSETYRGSVGDLSGIVRMNSKVAPRHRSDGSSNSPFILEYELKGHQRSGPVELRGKVQA